VEGVVVVVLAPPWTPFCEPSVLELFVVVVVAPVPELLPPMPDPAEPAV
jgi:hypothetical protein